MTPAATPSAPIASTAQRPAFVTSSGFFVQDGRLYDKFGNDFVMRGVNNPHIWFQNDALGALDAIARLGSNAVRVVWEMEGAAADLDQALARVIELDMIPMVELHDATGSELTSDLLELASYYARADVKAVLDRYEDYLLVNIANEWSGEDFFPAYQSAVQLLRDAGIDHTLVIDSNGFGQNADSVLMNGLALLDADPQHNLLFSVHMYSEFTNRQDIVDTLQTAVDLRLPLITGEFGFQFGDPPEPIDFPVLLAESARHGLGYLAWSWKGNSAEFAFLDLSGDWAGNDLTDWGQSVLQTDPNSVAATAQTASVFLLQ